MTEEFLPPNDPRADMTPAERRAREDNLQTAGEGLPGVVDEIIARSQQSDLIKARREYQDLLHRSQADASVDEAEVSAAHRRVLELQLIERQQRLQDRPPEQ